MKLDDWVSTGDYGGRTIDLFDSRLPRLDEAVFGPVLRSMHSAANGGRVKFSGNDDSVCDPQLKRPFVCLFVCFWSLNESFLGLCPNISFTLTVSHGH